MAPFDKIGVFKRWRATVAGVSKTAGQAAAMWQKRE
jgi:hypothetical protein